MTASTASKVSLDEKSARRIAAGRIAEYAKRELKDPLPEKRIAWLRALEARLEKVYGGGLLAVMKDKRKLICFILIHLETERPDTLELVVFKYEFGKEPIAFWTLHFSGHAIARLMERLRNADPIEALTNEYAEWTVYPLFVGLAEKNEFLILPTNSGYFMGTRDPDQEHVIIKTWLPDRLLTDREQKVLAGLRTEKKLAYCEKLVAV